MSPRFLFPVQRNCASRYNALVRLVASDFWFACPSASRSRFNSDLAVPAFDPALGSWLALVAEQKAFQRKCPEDGICDCGGLGSSAVLSFSDGCYPTFQQL